MELRARILVLWLLCAVSALKVPLKEINEFQEESLTRAESLSNSPAWQRDEADTPNNANKYRDKRALGLLLSGLAQIFGYTVTPIQLASLPNPNTTSPAAMANSTAAMANSTAVKGPQGAATKPANATAPRRQETIRFTGVVNLGNNSDILGHLRRYEQIFHGSRNSTTPATNATSPAPMPKPPANLSVGLTDSPNKPPLLTPFFVKIPLPLAPDLPPATMPIQNIPLTYPAPVFTIVDDSIASAPPRTPIRQEQETVYRNNEDSERYTVEDKEIYNEDDVSKYTPTSKYTHRLYVDEPGWEKQQEDRYNEVQRKQGENVARLNEKQRDYERHYDDREDESKERYRNREEEITDRDQEQISKYESSEVRRPNDEAEEEEESSAEKSTGHAAQTSLSNESSKQSSEEDGSQKTESYSNYDDNVEPNGQFAEKRPDQPLPADFDKYIELEYNQQLPIGDYFHEGNLEEIRDSYGEVLNNKKPEEDDRISGYFSMFKHPYSDAYEYQRFNGPENAPGENNNNNNKEVASAVDSYNEHLERVQKLQEEYAAPGPENKYEEYSISDESEGTDGETSRENEKTRSRESVKSGRVKAGRGKGDSRAKTTTSGSSKNELQRNDEVAKSQEEIGLASYTPLVVPVRYVDASDKVEQATTRRVKYKKSNKSASKPNSRGTTGSNVTPAPAELEKLTPQTARLPERPRQLHEGELRKELHIGVPPFDYVFDNTERTNTIVPVNPQHYPLNYYKHVMTNEDEGDANSDSSSDQPAGYLVVVGNPVHPYRYPYNIYYFHKDAIDPTDQALNVEATHQSHQLYAPQRATQADTKIAEYNRNESTKSPTVEYYYQPFQAAPQPYNTLDHYRYIFGEYAFPSGEPPDVNVKNQISNAENWSNRIYRPQSRVNSIDQPLPAQVQGVASSSRNAQDRGGPAASGQRSPQSTRRRKSPRPEDRRKNDRRAKTAALPRQPVPERRSFDDPQSAHDFFGFSRNDYGFDGESGNASKVTEENGKTARESRVLVTPEPIAYHDDESAIKEADEPENDTEKAVVREYRNKVATLRVSEQRRLRPNGPTHYVEFTRNIQ